MKGYKAFEKGMVCRGKPDAETERRVCAHLNEHKRRLKEDNRD